MQASLLNSYHGFQITQPKTRSFQHVRRNLAADLIVIDKPISGCVRVSGGSLLTTQVRCEFVNRQVHRQNLLSTGLLQVVSTSCNKSESDNCQQG